ncbi:MAG: ATP-dependent helicase [Fusobacterium sp.]|nr:ATP-dependent helicase [Fusobacterium sp.]
MAENKICPNAGQMECIKTLDGPVMVLAGPGTGKTFTIIQRIKYMLETGIMPDSILCLTYSEAAANEMKARLVKEIGTIASSVTIHTYHAFCNEIIRQNPMEFELLDGVGLVDDITKRTLMAETIDEIKPQHYKTKWGDSKYFIPELLSVVDEIKKNQVTKEDYFNTLENSPQWGGKTKELEEEYKEREAKGKLVKTFLASLDAHKKKIGKAVEAWAIFEKYDTKLKQKNFIDFNDMINMVLENFDTNEEFLKRVSAKFKYFLVDEYQDTNYAQNKIVFKLAEGAGTQNIFVVGDDDQIIYEFQGAKTDTLAKFLTLYPATKIICLTENNRSCQNILDLSYNIIAQDETRLEFNPQFAGRINKKLIAKNTSLQNNKIQLHSFADIKQENNFIVEEIEKLAKTMPDDLSQIAILTRENSELMNFVELLSAKNIQFQIKSSKSIFALKPSILIYFYLKTLENHELYADKLFGLLVSKPFDFELADYNFLLSQNRLNHKDFIANLRTNIDHEWADKDKVKNFLAVFENLKDLKATESLKNLIVGIINQTGILQYFVQTETNRIENIFAIKRIVDEAEAFMKLHEDASLADFIAHLDMAFDSGIPINIDRDEYTQNAVQLVTLHGAKGREFEYVFMPNLIAKKWEGKRISNSISLPIAKEEIDENARRKSEQLRLLFVGITRAKHTLTLSFSNTIEGKPQEFTTYLSRVIQNAPIVEEFTHELSRDDYTFEIAKSLTLTGFDYKTAFKDELEARIKDFILSPSALNCYQACPRNFLYTYILQIPVYSEEWDSANYGSAVHKTLEIAIKNAYPTKEEFCEIFLKNLSMQKFSNADTRRQFEERGMKKLTEFYPHFAAVPAERVVATEHYLKYVPVEDYFIKGFIDRIEKNTDGTFALYDYKTGSAKRKTQIVDGGDYENYLNQLRFYKFAFETQNEGAKVTQVGLIFVEEPSENFYTTLTYEDNRVIKEKILDTYKNIHALNFEPSEQDDKTCATCEFRQLCKLVL